MIENISIIKRLYKDYTLKFINKIILAILLSSLVAGSTSLIAYLLDPAIKKIFIEKDQTLLFLIPIIIIFAFAAKGISLYFSRVLMIGVAEEVKTNVQKDMMKALISADTKLIETKHTGKFVSNLTNDVGLLTNLISTVILNIFKDSLTLIGLLAVMFYQNWKLSLLAMIMIPLASLSARALGKRISKVTEELLTKAGFFTTHLVEVFKNHKLIKIFQAETYEKSRAGIQLDELKEKHKKMATVLVRAQPIMETLTGIMIAALIFYSGKLIHNNELEINNFFSFLAAMMLSYQPVRSLATLNMAINQGLIAAKRVLPIVDIVNTIQDKPDAQDLKISKGNINFVNVNFKYDTKERVVLKSGNLNIEGGKMTALVGHSGAGKSTILNLIPRFYDCDSGNILIDDQPIYQSSIYSLRKNISLVSQETTLFDDTVKNNIAYAKLDATDEEIELASKNSFASEFIEELPNKYNTIIGENGMRLSGGEKQRLSIARAMLKKSPIILLDEATSSLDSEVENKIQNAISLLTKNKTTVVIAHRLSTILSADKIYVVDAGKIVAEGNHENLLSNSPIYKNFYEKQIKRN
jgi:subfamily B ATP-binding cassette protein MsbA